MLVQRRLRGWKIAAGCEVATATRRSLGRVLSKVMRLAGYFQVPLKVKRGTNLERFWHNFDWALRVPVFLMTVIQLRTQRLFRPVFCGFPNRFNVAPMFKYIHFQVEA